MKNISILGVALILLGVGVLVFGHFSYTENKPVLDVGPIHVNAEEHHNVSIPLIAGIAILVAGLGLTIAGRRAA
jgi:uncharacterized membrane protein YidH (DUF202 family)